MLTAHEIYLAVRPTTDLRKRDLSIQPESNDVRVYLRAASAWRFINDWKESYAKHPNAATMHPGYVLELHLDQLFECEDSRLNLQAPERRFAFHERMFQNHAAWAAAYQDDRPSTLLDEHDLAMLRAAAEAWLYDPEFTGEPPQSKAELELTRVFTVLLERGKLGGRR